MRCNRKSLVNAVLMVVAAAAAVAAKGGSQDPATATFTDRVGDKIRSAGGSVYANGTDCVIAWVDSNASGFFFFRTTGGTCYNNTSQFRPIVLDFSDAISRQAECNCSLGPCSVNDAFGQGGGASLFPDQLDICGMNTVPDVRTIADKLFASSALAGGTPVTLAINLAPDFRYTAFELQFEQSVPVTEPAGGTRVMTAGSTRVAELYKINKKGPKSSLGRFRMPFELTVTK